MELEECIEILREKLYFLILNRELIDDEVVFYSQELDKLLVQYEQMNILKFEGNRELKLCI